MSRHVSGAAVAIAVLAAAPGASAATPPSERGPAEPAVATEPPLRPAFDPDVESYVVSCEPAAATRVRVAAPTGTAVGIDGAAPRAGTFKVSVDLAPGQRFELEARTPSGVRRHHVRCLPPDFPAFEAELTGRPQAQWYVVTPAFELAGGPGSRYVAIFDRGGVPVWWRDAGVRPGDARLTPNGAITWARVFGLGYGVSELGAYEERRLDGSLVRTIQTAGSPTDFHEIEPTGGGGHLLLTYRTREGVDLSPWRGPRDATVLDAEVQALNAAGNLAWSWNSRAHITISEARRWLPEIIAHPVQLADGRKVYDIPHVNSVAADGDGIVVSMRHTDAIYRIDGATGRIAWKLGGTPTPERLQAIGSGDGAPNAFGGQHDARLLADGTLTLFDNATNLSRPPRALRYRIDARRRTATRLESLTDPLAGASPCCGNARKLAGGNWVVAWGGVPLISELTPTGRPVLRLRFGGGIFSYRVAPVEPGRLDPVTLRAGMDAMHPR
jgi:hypothetical protein